MVTVEIQNIAFSFGEHEVIRGISHTFEPGKLSVIMGRNGSGKTTMVRCITKNLRPQKGRIYIDNKDINSYDHENLARKIALVTQGSNSVFGASVFETILTGRLPYMTWAPGPEDYNIVDKVIEKLSLHHLIKKNINEISGGERQKVFIARALAQKTPIIVLDEPITYLDLKHQLEIMTVMKNLATEGYNIIMVGHDLNLSLKYADGFLFLHNGAGRYTESKEEINESFIESVYGVRMKAVDYYGSNYYIPDI
ncbi:MAG: ABC transporter ATP-binding protein [Saprospiraceae bacterium]|nr:ABC transporter ATP-binding protein [Saprospiraceae bacterium]